MHRRRLLHRPLVEAALAGVRPRRRVLQVVGVPRQLEEERLPHRPTTLLAATTSPTGMRRQMEER